MIKLENEYTFDRQYCTNSTKYVDSCLKVFKNNRYYQTKKKVEDLPESYCVVYRCYGTYNVIRTDNIKDLSYHWIKENHFMKDSVLRISFNDKIKETPVYFHNTNGEKIKSWFVDYENVDSIVFGNNIFKLLGYIKKYSNYDISEIRNQFVKQCEWLKENEPSFAPDTDDYGKWFDNTIENAILWQH